MHTITGKISKIIYQNEDNGYTVALLKVKTSTVDKLENTTTQIVGNFYDLKYDVMMELIGDYELNQKYGKYQLNVKQYKLLLPSTKEKIIEFLTSSFIPGCGKKTAEALVDLYKEDTLEMMRDINNILVVKNMSQSKADKIHKAIINYDKTSDLIIKLETIGFSVDEAGKIINKYKDKTEKIIDENFYELKEIIDFNKLDHLYLNNHDEYSFLRIRNCVLEVMKIISNSDGHTYYDNEMISNALQSIFKLSLGSDKYDEIFEYLVNEKEIIIEDNKIYLKEYYDAENSICYNLKKILDSKTKVIKDFDDKILSLENMININYDIEQKKAIKVALNNNVSIISGGPGTGKTTILNALIKLYINEHKLSPVEIIEDIALVAPTGRASKKMSMSTGLYATTIHRYLKWHKENDSFEYDEFNKTGHKIVVVDEASMIDLKLFDALIKALKTNVKLILVGDSFQLPSVGAGLVLNNLIESDIFNYIPLTKIYRQSDNSFIPYLAKEIKNQELEEDFLTKKDDYNFINTDSNNLSLIIKKVILNAKDKGYTADNMQILAPMYKGENGIDNLNKIVRDIYNQKDKSKNEIIHNDILFREGDKVLQLVNDPDNNVYNGDIGYIRKIINGVKPIIEIDFDGNVLEVPKKYLSNIKHAYAISIHKSQGSEFDHVIMPIVKEYYVMMYNKLLYTGVSRAKKSLILLGDPSVFASGVRNDRANNRNTTLKEKLMSIILDNM